jgi:hypothetical protein
MKIQTSAESGSVRLLLFFLVVMIACFWKGGQDLYVVLSNRQPAAMSYDAFIKARPQATWLRLTNCTLDLSRVAFHSVKGVNRPYELFVPISSRNATNEESIHVILVTKNPVLIATTIEMQSLKTDAEIAAWVVKNHERLFPERDVQGLARFGVDMKDSERRKLMALDQDIVKDFTMIDDGSKPNLNSGLSFCGVGLLFLVGGAWYARSRREQNAADIL